MSRKLTMRLSALTTAAVLAAGIAACGGDDDDDESAATTETTTEETASAEEVTLTADEYTFELSATPTAETKSVVFDNQGKEPHALIFARLGEGFTVDEAFELEGKKGSAETLIEGGAGPGESQTFPVKGEITPGEYAMLCPIEGPDGPHYKLGQLSEFTIE
jgi:hypothetical protein